MLSCCHLSDLAWHACGFDLIWCREVTCKEHDSQTLWRCIVQIFPYSAEDSASSLRVYVSISIQLSMHCIPQRGWASRKRHGRSGAVWSTALTPWEWKQCRPVVSVRGCPLKAFYTDTWDTNRSVAPGSSEFKCHFSADRSCKQNKACATSTSLLHSR